MKEIKLNFLKKWRGQHGDRVESVMKNLLYCACLLTFVGLFTFASTENVCLQASDCSQCMQKSPDCVWCLDANFTSGENARRSRCNTLAVFNDTCQNTTDIKSSNQILKNDPFDGVVQLQPQEVTVNVRPGQPTTFNVSIKPAPDFPVDIYFLYDASNSTADDLDNLQGLSSAMAQAIQQITKNFRLGFGTFADKKEPPFTEGPGTPNFPCVYLPGAKCETPFIFKHSFDFSNDSTSFQNVVRNQSITGDYDDPEGSLEALMQLAVCEKVIGWQDKGKARRIVLLVTDELPKIAGDGWLIGVIRQNDGKCYMERRPSNELPMMYEVNDIMDYPSLAQLRDALSASEIFPIFAVTSEQLEVYREIAKGWVSIGATVDEIRDDSSNIVQLVRDNYQKISSTVSITEPTNNNLNFDFRVVPSTCNETYNPREPHRCTGVRIGQQVDIAVKVTAVQCPRDNQSESINLSVLGFGNVKLNVRYLCDCTCSSDTQSNSPRCNNAGTLECGICKCNANFYGSECQCDSTTQTRINDTLACTNPDDGQICSNEGSCVCGKCECFKKEGNREITGPFCQCKNFGCPTDTNGIECSGDDRGFCKCGRCECKPQFAGVNCGSQNCTYLEETVCRKNGRECSGNGRCDSCGACICNADYTGESCETCQAESCKCAEYDECVRCKAFPEKGANCTQCDDVNIIRVNGTIDQCRLQFNDTCLAFFQYSPNETITGPTTQNRTLIVLDRLVCTGELVEDDDDKTAIAIGTIAGIILLGLLLLLLLKVLLMLSDRREYKRFEKSNKKSQWQEDHNPIYHPPEQQFENPAFSGEQPQ